VDHLRAIHEPVDSTYAERTPAVRSKAGVRHGVAILNHVRWIAAAAVALGHLRNILLIEYQEVAHPGLFTRLFYFLTGFGHFAVIVFFVLSGYLVGGKVLNLLRTQDIDREWRRFLADRFARIFIVLVPALLLSGLVLLCAVFVFDSQLFLTDGWSRGWVAPIPHDLNPALWIGNLLLINGIFVDTVNVDGALWSLAYEWFYYMAAACVVVVYRRLWRPHTIVFVLYVLIVAVGVLIKNSNVLIAGGSWVAGVIARHIADRGYLKSRFVWITGMISVVIAILAFRSYPHIPDPVLGCCIAFALSHSRWSTVSLAPDLGNKLANFSYTLYLIHVPVIAFVAGSLQSAGFLKERMPFNLASTSIVIASFFAMVAIARLFAAFTEDRTQQLRNRILKAVL
jgi:peptidoglycan/LPS O-acetylase OafA/YrhL